MASSVLEKILPRGLGFGQKLPEVDMDFSGLEAQRKDMDERIERMAATLNGEEDWMLCLTKKPETCDDDSSR